MTILIKNGRVINPSENLDNVMDIYVEDGVIKEKAETIDRQADSVIDAKGCYVMPGLNRLARTISETRGLHIRKILITGSRAAAKGGFTISMLCMPNTKPVS